MHWVKPMFYVCETCSLNYEFHRGPIMGSYQSLLGLLESTYLLRELLVSLRVMMKCWGVFTSSTIEGSLFMWLGCGSMSTGVLVCCEGRQVMSSSLKECMSITTYNTAVCGTCTSEWWEDAAVVFILILFADGPLSPFPAFAPFYTHMQS